MTNPCSCLFQSYLFVYCDAKFEPGSLQKVGEHPITKLKTRAQSANL